MPFLGLFYVLLYGGAIGDTFILIYNNCRCHTDFLVGEWLLELDIKCLESPISANLIPLRHVWDVLGRRLLLGKVSSANSRAKDCPCEEIGMSSSFVNSRKRRRPAV
ncbi:hypothetical protein AVEN_208554-1 [Araneus ventricosus]|uniref:DDE-1 domain-containing protein n=1 Tax=Araneus ventricosus TaxID=182803 RepID=A0A4Y2R764_ARAVE|nr:hypothetical protein AVEN_208554-1 [Araneus ventricosus]